MVSRKARHRLRIRSAGDVSGNILSRSGLGDRARRGQAGGYRALSRRDSPQYMKSVVGRESVARRDSVTLDSVPKFGIGFFTASAGLADLAVAIRLKAIPIRKSALFARSLDRGLGFGVKLTFPAQVGKVAAPRGVEPLTSRLTADCSAAELRGRLWGVVNRPKRFATPIFIKLFILQHGTWPPHALRH